jgi:hypothetical protein
VSILHSTPIVVSRILDATNKTVDLFPGAACAELVATGHLVVRGTTDRGFAVLAIFAPGKWDHVVHIDHSPQEIRDAWKAHQERVAQAKP